MTLALEEDVLPDSGVWRWLSVRLGHLRAMRQRLTNGGANMATTTQIAERCRNILESHYGPQFRGLILYGSAARSQATAGSDIDLLVQLGEPFDYFCELRRIVGMLYLVQLQSEQLLSAKPAAIDAFLQGELQLYRNAKREGLRL